jgi:hypothetical protein
VKRNLRVVKWIGTVPAIAACSLCQREFVVPVSAIKRLADAQQNLMTQFEEHDCEQEKPDDGQ